MEPRPATPECANAFPRARIIELSGFQPLPFILQRLYSLPRVPPSHASYARKIARPWALLLLVPFVALLWVPFYNSSEPTLLGFPFFYWYQFLWVPITSILIYIVYLKTR